MRVIHSGKVKPLWRADRAAGGTVASFERSLDVRRSPGPAAHTFQGADNTAHLVVQKRARAQAKPDFTPAQPVNLLDRDLIKRLHRAFRLANAGAESREIVVAYEMRRAFAHRTDIEVLSHLPDQPCVMRRRCPALEQAKEIPPFSGRKPRVPVHINLCAIENCDRQGFKVMIECLREAKRIPFLFQLALCDLRQRMDSGVGTSRSGDRMLTCLQLGQSRFYSALNRGLIGLSLPSGEGRAIVFYLEGISWHGGLLARSTGWVQSQRCQIHR